MNTRSTFRFSAILVALIAMTGGPVNAAVRDDSPGARPGWVLDSRHGHNQYYPPAGYVSRSLPRDSVDVRYHGSPYRFNGGVWYRPAPRGYRVVQAPLGAFLPFLPPYYSTIWYGGLPYYYADGAYYMHDPVREGYIVTSPPDGVEAATQSAGDELFAYPKNGQSEEQQANDRYECHRWATSNSGFDPTQPLGGVAQSQVSSKRADYRRAQTACLESRGYNVK